MSTPRSELGTFTRRRLRLFSVGEEGEGARADRRLALAMISPSERPSDQRSGPAHPATNREKKAVSQTLLSSTPLERPRRPNSAGSTSPFRAHGENAGQPSRPENSGVTRGRSVSYVLRPSAAFVRDRLSPADGTRTLTRFSLVVVSRSLELSLQSSFQLSLAVLVGYRSRGSI